MKFIALTFSILIIVSCGGNSSPRNEPLVFERAGVLVITDPGDEEINIDFIDSNIPSDESADFRIDMGEVVSPNGRIEILEMGQRTTGLTVNQFLETDSADSVSIEEFGMEVELLSSSLGQSASLLESQKLIVQVNPNRAVTLYKLSSVIGALNRHHFVWALYSNESNIDN